jgi:DNA-binding IclR family transcriptional regulator
MALTYRQTEKYKMAAMRNHPEASPEGREDERRQRDPLYVRSVEKAFLVLKAFDAERPTLSLSQLMHATGLEKSAVQRFSHTLCELGYLHRDPATKRFQLAPRTLRHAYHYTQSNPLVRLAAPYLSELRRQTGEAVSLSVLEGVDLIYVLRLLSTYSLARTVVVGAQVPAFCVAAGLAILSRLPEARALAILEQSDLRAYTERTETRIPEIMARLRRIVAQGYVVCVDEYILNNSTIAAPIIGVDGFAVGAISISPPPELFSAEKIEADFASIILSTVNAISA